MNRYILFIAMMIGLLSSMYPKVVFGDVSANEQNSDVSITITNFQVNDQTLELGWKIVNSSDHDVWICDNITVGSDFDWFLDNDDETLKIIKRSSLPQGQGWEHWPWVRFIRLRPGQDKEDSISLTVPVRPNTKFSHPLGNAEFAKRLSLEIGFYDEDLRGLILNIVDLTEQLSFDTSLLSSIVTPDAQIRERFFAGVYIAQVFHDKSFGGFRNKVLSDGDEISMPFMDQLFHGEQVLQATIEDVEIPYKSNYPPLTDEPTQNETESNSATMALTKLDVNEPIITPRVNNQRLELSWKIRNNTDHDVWILVSQTPEYAYVYDVFLDADAKTLVLRRRFNLPEGQGWEHLPRARYVRLRPDQEITESVSLALPVKPRTVFNRLLGNAEFAKRLAVEIGYYDEDLPGLILQIVDMAEQLNCDIGLDSPIHDPYDMEVRRRFFGGVFVARFFYLESFEYFRNSVTSGGDEVFIPYMWQTLEGEKILRIEVDNVSIPYESKYPPLND